MRLRRLNTWLAALGAVFTAAGCSGGEAGADGTILRDSAGIAIAENDHTKPAWGAGGWRLTEAPLVQIGSMDAEGPEQFGRVFQARFLPSGDVAVVDYRRQHVVIFDGEGRHRRTIGRNGDGPGEFREPSYVYLLPGDSLMVVDYERAVSVFDPAGAYVRRFVPDNVVGARQGRPNGQFDDGTLLLMKHQRANDVGRTGVGWREVEPVQVGLDGTILTRFGNFKQQLNDFGSEAQFLFAPRAMFVPDGDGFWYALGDRFELHRIGMDRRVTRMVRLDRPLQPVTPADIEQVRQPVRPQISGDGPASPRSNDINTPEFFPAHDRVLLDDERNLWIQEYRPAEVRVARTWWVFDAEGRYLGPVGMPAGFTPYQVRGGKVVGLYTDESDVEFVRVYGVVR